MALCVTGKQLTKGPKEEWPAIKWLINAEGKHPRQRRNKESEMGPTHSRKQEEAKRWRQWLRDNRQTEVARAPLDSRAAKLWPSAEVSNLGHSGESWEVQGQPGQPNEIVSKRKRQAEWGQSSVAGYLSVCEPLGSITTTSINQSVNQCKTKTEN